MTDELTISDLPEYGEVMAKHKAALAEAEAAGDDNAIKAVRLDWDRERFGLEKRAVELQTQRRQLNETRTKLKEQYPNLPEGILDLTDDPSKMEALAKDTHEKMTAGAPTGAGWGKGPATAPGGGGGAPQAISVDELQTQLAPKIRAGDREAVLTANRALFADKIGTRFVKFEEES